MPRWMVFGRTGYPDPLRHKGLVEAPDAGVAAERALERYGRQWVELTLVPEEAIRWVLRDVSEEPV